MSRLLVFFVHAYRASRGMIPWGGNCRHWPSCSVYAEEALRRHGAAQGLKLAAVRLVRCHPWGGAGFDPVPEKVHP